MKEKKEEEKTLWPFCCFQVWRRFFLSDLRCIL